MKLLLLLVLFTAPAIAADQQQLASECQRGFQRSCDTLRKLQVYGPPTRAIAPALRYRLFEECRRGFQPSCQTLDALLKPTWVIRPW